MEANVALLVCGGASSSVAVNARKCTGIVSPPSCTDGFRDPVFCILIPMPASPPPIQGKSRMRERACTDLCGGRSAMVVPTAIPSLCIFFSIFAGSAFGNLKKLSRRSRTNAPKPMCAILLLHRSVGSLTGDLLLIPTNLHPLSFLYTQNYIAPVATENAQPS
jgi:hypothetical protein